MKMITMNEEGKVVGLVGLFFCCEAISEDILFEGKLLEFMRGGISRCPHCDSEFEVSYVDKETLGEGKCFKAVFSLEDIEDKMPKKKKKEKTPLFMHPPVEA